MVRYNHITCIEAEKHYLDYLTDRANVPDNAARHILTCPACRKSLDQLEQALKTGFSNIRERDEITLYMLGLHMNFAGKPVDCQAARPFLPTLAEPYMAIQTLTPITAHVEHCPQCKAKLDAIQSLELTSGQLRKLSILMSVSDRGPDPNPEQAERLAEKIVRLEPDALKSNKLDSVFRDPDMADRIFRRRETYIHELDSRADSSILPCEILKPGDIFDLAVPFAEDREKPTKPFLEGLAKHIQHCPQCMKTLQRLHVKLTELLFEANSNIVTVFESTGQAGQENPAVTVYGSVKDAADFRQTESGDIAIAGKAQSRAGFAKVFKFKIALGLAAVLLAAFTLLPLFTHTVQATSFEQVSDRVSMIDTFRRVHISPETNKILAELYYSKSREIYAQVTEHQVLIHDLKNQLVHRGQGSDIESAAMTDQQARTAKQRLTRAASSLLMAADAPTSQWTEADSTALENVPAESKVYDLEWTSTTAAGKKIRNLRRYFINSQTHLPYEIHAYRQWQKSPGALPEMVIRIEILEPQELMDMLLLRAKSLTE